MGCVYQAFNCSSTNTLDSGALRIGLGCDCADRKKGYKTHRTIGRVYVAAMVVTSVSAFFVRSLEPGEQWHIARNFSWIHLLIPFTLFYLTLAIVYIRKGRVKDHYRSMIFTYIGGILVAGAFTGICIHCFLVIQWRFSKKLNAD